jgi:hypothetical protein
MRSTKRTGQGERHHANQASIGSKGKFEGVFVVHAVVSDH